MGSRRRDAFEHAVEALGRRERTTAELESWLGERGYPAAEVEAAIARLAEAGALDDGRFARRYAEDKRELAGWGSGRIREALRARGLDPELVEAALAEGDELERAVAALAKRGQPLGDEAARQRALGFLVRRGYELELAYEAVRRYERSSSPGGALRS